MWKQIQFLLICTAFYGVAALSLVESKADAEHAASSDSSTDQLHVQLLKDPPHNLSTDTPTSFLGNSNNLKCSAIAALLACSCWCFAHGLRSKAAEKADSSIEGVPQTHTHRYLAIDGLRAVAVMAVITFHMNHAWLPGGFTGVDIFFCISGYVNAGSLLRQQVTFVGIIEFCGRRMWRLAPALMVVVFATAIVTALLVPPEVEDLKSYYLSGFLGLVGQSNNYFASLHLDYFEVGHKSHDFNPFMQLWSLAVEEQFYVLFPFILLWAQSEEMKRVALGICIGVSIALSCFLTMYKSEISFYTLPSRFWEMALGASVFFMARRAGAEGITISMESTTKRGLLQISVLVLLTSSLLFTPEHQGFPFPLALLGVGGTVCFMLLSTVQGSIMSTCFHQGLPVYIGRLSYSLYLWHWPVFVFFRRTIGLDHSGGRFMALAITLLLAITTYHGVEAPMHKNRPKRTATICFLLLPLLAITSLSLWLLAVPFNGILYVGFENPSWSSTSLPSTSSAVELCPGGGRWQSLMWLPTNASTCPTDYSWPTEAMPPRSLVFLGDSTMAKLKDAMSSTICDKGAHVKKQGHPNGCDVMEYMGMNRSSAWVSPTPGSKEGPVRYGLEHPFCIDCEGICGPVQFQCLASESRNQSKNLELDLEYLPMEFTFDREMQSTEGATTQATIAAYLRKRSSRADAIIMNQGIHDLDLHGMQAEDYVQHVRGNLQSLQSSAKLIVWLFTNSILNYVFLGGSNAEWNEQISAWNEAVRAMIVKEFPHVFILDVFKMSQVNNMRIDALHMVPSYYVAEARIIMGFLSRNLFQDSGSAFQVGSDLPNRSSTVLKSEVVKGVQPVNVQRSVAVSPHGSMAAATSGSNRIMRQETVQKDPSTHHPPSLQNVEMRVRSSLREEMVRIKPSGDIAVRDSNSTVAANKDTPTSFPDALGGYTHTGKQPSVKKHFGLDDHAVHAKATVAPVL